MNASSDLLENTWKMESARKKVFSSKQTRMEVIHEHSMGDAQTPAVKNG